MGPTSCCRRCIVAAATVRRSRTVVLCTAPVVSTATKPSERQPRTVSCSPIPGFRCSFGAALLCSAHHAGAPSAHPPPTHRLRRHRPWQHCTTSATWQPVARTKPTTHPACKLGLHRWREGVEEASSAQHTPLLALADAPRKVTPGNHLIITCAMRRTLRRTPHPVTSPTVAPTRPPVACFFT